MKTLSKILLYPLCALMLLGGVLHAAPRVTLVYAETAEDIQAQVDAVLAKFGIAKTQLGLSPKQLRSEEIPSTFRFPRTLLPGAHGVDVRYLQIFLNRDQGTRVNAPGLIGGAGSETDYYGRATRIAVGKFQNKYATDVLRPGKLLKDTGTIGPLTRNKLNTLLTLAFSQPKSAPVPQSIPASANVPTPLGTTTPPAPVVAVPTFSFEEINQKTRLALVNIICTSRRGGLFNLISGSGVIIDPRGVILTNAHLGQYFLLQDFPTPGSLDCVIRSGEPARNRYRATLLFISSTWVHDNAKKITLEEPTGTGENDFALLLIQSAASEAFPLPETFPYITMDLSDSSLRVPTEVLVAAYPVGFLSGITTQKDLYPSSSLVVTGTVYGFGEETPDVFSLGGSVVAQQGSSGGAVVSRENKLIGLIVTASAGATTGERNLNALTMSHIDASFRTSTGESIHSVFTEDLKKSAQDFNEKVAPELRKILTDQLTK